MLIKPMSCEVGSKDVGIFINGSILNDSFFTFSNVQNLTVPAIEEVYLKIE